MSYAFLVKFAGARAHTPARCYHEEGGERPHLTIYALHAAERPSLSDRQGRRAAGRSSGRWGRRWSWRSSPASSTQRCRREEAPEKGEARATDARREPAPSRGRSIRAARRPPLPHRPPSSHSLAPAARGRRRRAAPPPRRLLPSVLVARPLPSSVGVCGALPPAAIAVGPPRRSKERVDLAVPWSSPPVCRSYTADAGAAWGELEGGGSGRPTAVAARPPLPHRRPRRCCAGERRHPAAAPPEISPLGPAPSPSPAISLRWGKEKRRERKGKKMLK